MTTAPSVTVVTPNFNHGRHLPQLCAALAAQVPPPLELVIVDDGSTDDSVAIIRDLTARYSFVRLIQQPGNFGVVAAMNRGFAEATGRYTVLRSADDLDLPGFYETAVPLLDQHPEASLFCGDVVYFSSRVEDGVRESLGFAQEPSYFPKHAFPRLLGSRFVNGHAVMVRTELLRSCTPFFADTLMLADWFHLMVAGFRGGFCYAPIPVAAARLDSGSFGNRALESQASIDRAHAAILDALAGPFRDVRADFVSSGALEMLGSSLAAVVRAHPRFAVYAEVAARIEARSAGISLGSFRDLVPCKSYGLEEALRLVLTRKREQILAHVSGHPGSRLWLYGAGGHSIALLRAWNGLGLPAFSGVLQSNGSGSRSFFQLPVRSVMEADLLPKDLVVLSSKSFEGTMAATLRSRGHANVLAIWNSALDQG